nr:geranylgeranyl pyrophosphate synthase (GGPPS2) [Polytomella parva]|eukprot:CAMPEP_0175039510 /NCGR_PEP_ID=MMETSP0052_2-20121109/631_1 /TAXON_ID=51329 ORGANISM="Polytomella parva, Strain SAG 63-3" /NCGR_SAMPLE_ID=MMETSP0052_2 /ASSEMBLY_ACC=CAM_ASM_000194 /LENGTH=357 /DNA_ID=CAMNT_0016301385 /DNA_START=291 /DNA_END=1364 /DNA_ORIENTATION=+
MEDFTKNSNNSQLDPFSVVRREVETISERLRHSVTTTVPSLKTAAEYFFNRGVEGKRLRPTLAMLMSSALAEAPPAEEFMIADLRPASVYAPELRRRQQRVAEIAELIHVASLMHDDVLDEAATRRGVLSLNSVAGNKIAILAGDFLLARASVSLASLRNNETVELMSNVLENLVAGEVMQMTASQDQLTDMDHYLSKSYCKTAALMANSCRSVAAISEQTEEVRKAAWDYGRNLGLAFQIVDDILDLTVSSSMLGKPALNDMKSGLATAPVLFAMEEKPELKPLILRRFKQEGDIAKAMELVEATQGIQRAKDLAAEHCHKAAAAIGFLPAAQSAHTTLCREALLRITDKVLTRTK